MVPFFKLVGGGDRNEVLLKYLGEMWQTRGPHGRHLKAGRGVLEPATTLLGSI